MPEVMALYRTCSHWLMFGLNIAHVVVRHSSQPDTDCCFYVERTVWLGYRLSRHGAS
jgi:hypothetical protein